MIFGQLLNFAGLSGALVEFTDSFNLGPIALPLVSCADGRQTSISAMVRLFAIGMRIFSRS